DGPAAMTTSTSRLPDQPPPPANGAAPALAKLSPDQQLLTAPARLLLTALEAAQALAVSPRPLWQLTRNGEIPVVRLGRCVRYDPADLKRFIESRKGR